MSVLKILIVDDSPDDAKLIAYRARRAGFEIEWNRVETEEAFAAALAGVDLVICDYSMPLYSPDRALAHIAATGHSVPFLLVSGSVTAQAAAQLVQAGAAGYLLKDQLEKLGPAIHHALAQKTAA
ncbi:MAG: response regulator [Kofleriaceae bacterium]